MRPSGSATVAAIAAFSRIYTLWQQNAAGSDAMIGVVKDEPRVNTNEGHGMTVLIVEDDRAMVDLVRTYLEHAGYRVEVAETGEEGIEAAQRVQPHLILLDLMLPLRSGWETCRALRARADVPIIMVTARRAEEDRLRGFAVGADDYVIKPFSPRELVARVGAVLRRHHATTVQAITVGPLTVDPRRREARGEGAPVPLRAR